MKRVLAVCAGWLLLLSGLLSGCTGEKGDSADSPLWGDMEEVEDSVPKATAIAWVDCDRNRSFSSARTVKVKAYIHHSGKISVLEYVKKPPLRVQSWNNPEPASLMPSATCRP